MEWEAWETHEALARLDSVVRSHSADGIARTFVVTQCEVIDQPPQRRDSTTEPMPFGRAQAKRPTRP